MRFHRIVATLLILALLLGLAPAAMAKWKDKDGNEVESGENWFGADFSYDITDTAAMWELLQRPITVLDLSEKESVYPLDAPDGKKIYKDKLGGFLNGYTAAVHVLGEDENGWTLIEGLDYYDRLIKGYVKTSLLITRTPNEHYGIIVDKLFQKLYFFIDGQLFSSCDVSTGLVNKDQPYNVTSTGEYLTASFVGQFVDEDMYCDKVIRYNNGDAIHEVPYILRADGTKGYSSFEGKLGTMASHGCIRVQRKPNEDGLCQQFIWDTLRENNTKGVKLIVWDDDGRPLPYPSDDLKLYYNPNGGKNYHSTAECAGVKKRYWPLTEFTYAELDSGDYASLTACDTCKPVQRKAEIDAKNAARGVETQGATVSVTTDDASATAEPGDITSVDDFLQMTTEADE